MTVRVERERYVQNRENKLIWNFNKRVKYKKLTQKIESIKQS